MNVLAKGDGFEGDLAAYVDRVTEELDHLLAILSPLGSDNVRRKNGLRDIVEQGAKLAVEVRLDIPGSEVSITNTLRARSINSLI